MVIRSNAGTEAWKKSGSHQASKERKDIPGGMAHLAGVQWEVDRGSCAAQGVLTYLEGNAESSNGFKPQSNVYFRSGWRRGRKWIGGNETGGGTDCESPAVVQVRGDESLSQWLHLNREGNCQRGRSRAAGSPSARGARREE